MASSSSSSSLRVLLLLLLVAVVVLSSCPNYVDVPYCSGHGDCTYEGRCACWEGWAAADCSERTCPFAEAWQDAAGGTDDAHGLAECSNRGSCDRLTGRCACDDGFQGRACERLRCRGTDSAGLASACSGHGSCLSLYDYARWFSNDRSESFAYQQVWDAHKSRGCLCAEGYEGPDCSTPTCPLGDDPLTTGQSNEIQLVSCGGVGSFKLVFKGLESSEILSGDSAAEVAAALQGLEHLTGELEVRFSTTARACHAEAADFEERNVIEIEFKSLFGEVPEFKLNDLYGETFSGSVDIVKATQGSEETSFIRAGEGYVYASRGTKEYEPCARRGECSVSGICECFTSNFELYGSSDSYGAPGTSGDCGYPLTEITMCPGEEACSNNGVCDSTELTPAPTPRTENKGPLWTAKAPYSCTCNRGWQLGDCSQRICPRGYSWFSYPSADDSSHDALLECSGIGDCDRTDASCACPAPFRGAACEYMDCPPATSADGGATACNGHGQCLSMRHLAQELGETTYGSDPNSGKTWDADRIFGCLCDQGYEGHDCSLRSCPRGDDPNTLGQVNELQLLKCYADSGHFRLEFLGKITSSIAFNASATDLEAALENLASIRRIQVTYSHGTTACTPDSTTQNVIHIQFITEHSNLPDITVHGADGDDDDTLFRGAANAQVRLKTDGDSLSDHLARTFYSHAGTTESEPCSNRGTCDTATGICDCFPSYSLSDALGGPGTIPDCGYRLPY